MSRRTTSSAGSRSRSTRRSTRSSLGRRQRQLVADASHELRTPIASLRANIQVLEDADRLAPADREALRADIVAELDELTALVADVMELARGSKLRRGAWTTWRLDLIVDAQVERAQRRSGEAVLFQEQIEPTVVAGEPERISRAVSNLLTTRAAGVRPAASSSGAARRTLERPRPRPGVRQRRPARAWFRALLTAPTAPVPCRAPASAWRSCARPPRPTAAWRRPDNAPGGGAWCGCASATLTKLLRRHNRFLGSPGRLASI